MTVSLKRKINDAGEKIGGARKDWAMEKMLLSDVMSMTDEEGVKHITKENIWPKPDYAKLVENGMEPMAAALVKVMRDRIAKSPELSKGVPYRQTLEWYFETLSKISKELEACKTVDEVSNYYRRFTSDYISNSDKLIERANRSKFYTVIKGRTIPIAVSLGDPAKAKKLLAQGFPSDVPAWRKGYFVKEIYGRQGLSLIKGKYIVQGGFASEDAAYEWLRAKLDQEKNERKETDGEPRKAPVRPHLRHIERVGLPDWREGVDVTPQMFIDTFGFRAVEFGEWLPDDERQQVLNFGYDALMDLAHVLRIQPGHVSLDGTLAVAFGARGQGSFAAHYEAERRVVNITRISGAGALAHEWGHALDHMLGTGTAVPMQVPSMSGWHTKISDCTRIMSHRGSEVAQIAQELLKAILTRPVTKDELVAQLSESVASFEKSTASYENAISRYGEKIEAGHQTFSKAHRNKLEKGYLQQKRGLEHWKSQLDLALSKPENAFFGTTTSNFQSEAIKISGADGYWARPTELFARAFESFVYKELEEAQQSSSYLVAWADNQFFPAELYKGRPYPEAAELSHINDCFRQLIERAMEFVPDRAVANNIKSSF